MASPSAPVAPHEVAVFISKLCSGVIHNAALRAEARHSRKIAHRIVINSALRAQRRSDQNTNLQLQQMYDTLKRMVAELEEFRVTFAA